MTLRLTFLIAIVLIGSAFSPVRWTQVGAQESPPVPALALNVMDVRVFGKWAHEDKKGYFRGIIAREKPGATTLHMFLQWIAVAKDNSTSLYKTLSPPELIKEGVSVLDFRHEMDADGLALFIDTIHPKTRADITFEMFVFNPDEYEINPASN